MRSQRARLWRFIAGCCLIGFLCAGCSDANVAKHSGEYKLDKIATESKFPGSEKVLKNVLLTLNSDGSFTLTGKFAGVSRTDKGTWSIAGETITLNFTHVGKQATQFTKVVYVDDDRLTLETRVQNRDVAAVFSKDTFPPWGISIIFLIMLVVLWVMYAQKESPNVHFEGGSPEFVLFVGTVFSIIMIIVGIIGTFKPEVVVWATEAIDTFSTLQYLGFLAFIAVAIVAWAAEEGRVKNFLWAVFGLGVVALFVWLYFRFGVEVTIGGP